MISATLPAPMPTPAGTCAAGADVHSATDPSSAATADAATQQSSAPDFAHSLHAASKAAGKAAKTQPAADGDAGDASPDPIVPPVLPTITVALPIVTSSRPPAAESSTSPDTALAVASDKAAIAPSLTAAAHDLALAAVANAQDSGTPSPVALTPAIAASLLPTPASTPVPSPSPPVSAPTVPTVAAGSAQQLMGAAHALASQGTNGSTQLVLRLDPPGVGNVSVRLVSRGGEVNVSVRTDSVEAINGVSSVRDHVEASLAKVGLTLGNVSVSQPSAASRTNADTNSGGRDGLADDSGGSTLSGASGDTAAGGMGDRGAAHRQQQEDSAGFLPATWARGQAGSTVGTAVATSATNQEGMWL